MWELALVGAGIGWFGGATNAAGFVGRATAGTTYVFPLKEKCRFLPIGLTGCLCLRALSLVGRARDTWTRERTRRADDESDSCIKIEMHSPLSLSSYLYSLPQI